MNRVDRSRDVTIEDLLWLPMPGDYMIQWNLIVLSVEKKIDKFAAGYSGLRGCDGCVEGVSCLLMRLTSSFEIFESHVFRNSTMSIELIESRRTFHETNDSLVRT